MYILILLTHIVSMSAALLLMSGAVGMALFGARSSVKVASVGMIATISGFLTGAVLLFAEPLPAQCALLAAFVVAMAGLYRYGFGMGRVENARIVRGI